MTKLTRLTILSFASIALIYGFLMIAIPACLDHAAACKGTVSEITIISYRYRLLLPALTYTFVPPGDAKGALAFDLVLQIILSPLMVVGLYKWLRRWTSEDRAIIGVLAFTGVYLLSFPINLTNMTIAIEVTCIVWALVFINRFWIVGLLMIIASINRETGLAIAALYFLYHWNGLEDYLKWLAGLTLIAYSGLITAAIHIAMGGGDSILGFGGTLAYNIGTMSDDIAVFMVLLPLAVAVLAGYRNAPDVLKRLAWVAALYVLAILVGGAYDEALRTMLPVIAITLPMMVQYKHVTDAYMNDVQKQELDYNEKVKQIQRDFERELQEAINQ